MAVFRRSASEEFESRLLSHIEEFFPVHWREAGEDNLHSVIRIGIANAAGYGLKKQNEIYLFVALMLYLGSYFDTDQLLYWAAASLKDSEEPDPFTRVETTYNSAVAYLERVAGPDAKHSAAAMERFVKIAPELGRLTPANFSGMLRWLHPEKCAELSEAQLNRVLTDGHQSAQENGLADVAGVFLYATLAFLLGHGFAKDPQFPWAAKVLTDETVLDPKQRVTAMQEASVTRLRRWFGVAESAA